MSRRWEEVKAFLVLEKCENPHVVSLDSRVDSVIGVVCERAFLVPSWGYAIILQPHRGVLHVHYYMIYLTVYLLYLTLLVCESLMNTLIC